MPLHNIASLSSQVDSEDDAPLSRELENSRKISFNLLVAFLTVHSISASHVLGATTLVLLVYTINLHIAVNMHFIRHRPTLSKVLHVIPLVGVFCMTVFKLVMTVQSPAIAAGVLLVCALPPISVAAHSVKRYAEVKMIPLPVQMRAAAVPGSTEQSVSN